MKFITKELIPNVLKQIKHLSMFLHQLSGNIKQLIEIQSGNLAIKEAART